MDASESDHGKAMKSSGNRAIARIAMELARTGESKDETRERSVFGGAVLTDELKQILHDPSAPAELSSPWFIAALTQAADQRLNAEKHAAMRRLAFDALETHCPGLLGFIVLSKATIFVALGRFAVLMPHTTAWIDVPELGKHLRLAPWAEPSERAH